MPDAKQRRGGQRLTAIWEAKNRQAAVREFTRVKARWWTDEERAVRCLETVLKDCLDFFDEPPEFWRSVRTTDEPDRRTRSSELSGR